jgi:hypothetical protein
VQGRAWREEIPQTSFVPLAFPLPPSCEAVRASVVVEDQRLGVQHL